MMSAVPAAEDCNMTRCLQCLQVVCSDETEVDVCGVMTTLSPVCLPERPSVTRSADIRRSNPVISGALEEFSLITCNLW